MVCSHLRGKVISSGFESHISGSGLDRSIVFLARGAKTHSLDETVRKQGSLRAGAVVEGTGVEPATPTLRT